MLYFITKNVGVQKNFFFCTPTFIIEPKKLPDDKGSFFIHIAMTCSHIILQKKKYRDDKYGRSTG